MFHYLYSLYKNRRWEICLIISIGIIIYIWLCNKTRDIEGTWTDTFDFSKYIYSIKNKHDCKNTEFESIGESTCRTI